MTDDARYRRRRNSDRLTRCGTTDRRARVARRTGRGVNRWRTARVKRPMLHAMPGPCVPGHPLGFGPTLRLSGRLKASRHKEETMNAAPLISKDASEWACASCGSGWTVAAKDRSKIGQ